MVECLSSWCYMQRGIPASKNKGSTRKVYSIKFVVVIVIVIMNFHFYLTVTCLFICIRIVEN
jgi:hypothetical protein